MNFIKKNWCVYDVMPHAFFNDIHELKCGQAEEKLEAGGDEKLIFGLITKLILLKLLHNILVHTALFARLNV